MKPGLLGVFIASTQSGGERSCLQKAAERLRSEYEGYEVRVLFLSPQGAESKVEFEVCRAAMQRDAFEILLVSGSFVSKEVYDLFDVVPPDCEVINDSHWMSDLDEELQSRFRSQNRTAVTFTHELAQALA
jgi:hypothetical protein